MRRDAVSNQLEIQHGRTEDEPYEQRPWYRIYHGASQNHQGTAHNEPFNELVGKQVAGQRCPTFTFRRRSRGLRVFSTARRQRRSSIQEVDDGISILARIWEVVRRPRCYGLGLQRERRRNNEFHGFVEQNLKHSFVLVWPSASRVGR